MVIIPNYDWWIACRLLGEGSLDNPISCHPESVALTCIIVGEDHRE